jgi:hypothetical protein
MFVINTVNGYYLTFVALLIILGRSSLGSTAAWFTFLYCQSNYGFSGAMIHYMISFFLTTSSCGISSDGILKKDLMLANPYYNFF